MIILWLPDNDGLILQNGLESAAQLNLGLVARRTHWAVSFMNENTNGWVDIYDHEGILENVEAVKDAILQAEREAVECYAGGIDSSIPAYNAPLELG